METYETKAVVNKISATSRMSVKINDTFYTLEYSEERLIPAVEGVNLEEERKALWECVNNEVDNQVHDIYSLYKK